MNELLTQAVQKRKEKNFTEAITLLKQASDKYPHDHTILLELINCYFKDDRENAAQEYYKAYKYCLQNFVSSGAPSEFLPRLNTINRMLICIAKGKLSKEFRSIQEWDLSKAQSEEDFNINLTLTRLQAALYLNVLKVPEASSILERVRSIIEKKIGQKLKKSDRDANAKKDRKPLATIPSKPSVTENRVREADTHKAYAISYFNSKHWGKCLNELAMMTQKELDFQFVRKYFLLIINKPGIHLLVEEKFLPRLKQEFHPNYKIFWDLYISQKLKTLAQSQKNHNTIKTTHALIDIAFTSYPGLYLYLYKATLYRLEEKFALALDTLAQAFDSANDVLAKSIESNEARANIFGYLCLAYFSHAIQKYKIDKVISERDSYNLAYAKMYLPHFSAEEGLSICCGTPPNVTGITITDKKLIATITARGPLAKEVDDIRRQSLDAWINQQQGSEDLKVRNWNAAADKINKLFTQHHLPECHQKKIVWPPSLFTLASLRVSPEEVKKCPAAVQERVKAGFFQPYQWEKPAKVPSLEVEAPTLKQ